MAVREKKVILITGCGSGFGKLTALTFARAGWHVVAAVRVLDARSDALRQENIQVIKIDVTKQEDVDREIPKVLEKYGKIDVLVNNAGFGFTGPVEDFTVDEIREQYETNIFGTIRMMQAVLPSMRARKRGRIINISSVNGRLSFGLYGIYSSTKFAIETISESLRFEVKPFGVDVVLIEPGAFITNFYLNGKKAKKYAAGDPVYAGLENPISQDKSSIRDFKNHSLVQRFVNPQRVADKIFMVANLTSTKIRYKVGIDTHVYIAIRAIVPDWLWEWILHRAYGW